MITHLWVMSYRIRVVVVVVAVAFEVTGMKTGIPRDLVQLPRRPASREAPTLVVLRVCVAVGSLLWEAFRKVVEVNSR